jgi:DNA-binding MurR/RpiR family transcriptional regulator
VVLAVSVAPYTRATVEVVQFAQARSIPVVAITDSAVSPLARAAAGSVLAAVGGPSFFHSMAAPFVVGEILAALVAGRGGDEALEELRRAEEQLACFQIHWSPRDARRT